MPFYLLTLESHRHQENASDPETVVDTQVGGRPGGPVVKTALPLEGAWIQSLVWELRSHMPGGVAK